MKISYKVLKSYLPNLPSPEEVAQKLVMHTAEVEEVVYEWENLKDVFVWEVLECEKHPDSDKLNCTKVKVWNDTLSIVCWASNVRAGLKVPVAIVGCQLAPDFVIAKTKIRGEASEGMICSMDELGLCNERQEWIWELPENAPNGMSMRHYLDKTDAVLEIDNKAINHRPDMFSHIWVIRELAALYNEKMPVAFAESDFSNLEELPLENTIPEVVSRFSALKIEGVENIESPDYMMDVLSASDCSSKGLLVDMTNYSLYFYGKPVHAFDADKIEWKIVIRYAKDGEKFTALDDNEYELSGEDIVVADDSGVIGLGWIIWGKHSAVDNNTTSIVLESANFDQAVLRKTWRRLWIRTDALNVFEKSVPEELSLKASALIYDILSSTFPNAKATAFADSYTKAQESFTVPLDFGYINSLIWKDYSEERVLEILTSLGFEVSGAEVKVPFFRTDVTRKADIAEEVARIDGFDKVESTLPRIEVWAVSQDPIYKFKKDAASFFVDRGFYEMYNYSFVWEEIMQKMNSKMDNLVPLKNYLSEDASHMRPNLISNLMNSLEENIRDESDLKLFELEKVYTKNASEIEERYSLAWVITNQDSDVLYYELTKILEDFFKTVGVNKYAFDTLQNEISFAHNWRTWEVIIRGQSIGQVWEIHPLIAKRFDVKGRVAYFELDVSKLLPACYSLIKAKEISIYQENNFDLAFLIDKEIKASKIESAIKNSDQKHISNVELVDIYENEERLPGKRSLAYRIYISSLDWTLWDDVKWNLIKTITERVSKVGWELRG